jgi:hypothetical protein
MLTAVFPPSDLESKPRARIAGGLGLRREGTDERPDEPTTIPPET